MGPEGTGGEEGGRDGGRAAAPASTVTRGGSAGGGTGGGGAGGGGGEGGTAHKPGGRTPARAPMARTSPSRCQNSLCATGGLLSAVVVPLTGLLPLGWVPVAAVLPSACCRDWVDVGRLGWRDAATVDWTRAAGLTTVAAAAEGNCLIDGVAMPRRRGSARVASDRGAVTEGGVAEWPLAVVAADAIVVNDQPAPVIAES